MYLGQVLDGDVACRAYARFGRDVVARGGGLSNL